MTGEFAAGKVAGDVIAELERQREALAKSPEATRAAVETALAPVRTAYVESQLPPAYFAALEGELRETLPAAWVGIAHALPGAGGRAAGDAAGGVAGDRPALLGAGGAQLRALARRRSHGEADVRAGRAG